MTIDVRHGDSRDVIASMADASVDSVVTDPPYALVSIVKRFGGANAAPAKGDVYARAAAGFMGKQWDTGEVAFDPAFWADVLRVLKPGGHLIAFGGTRTYHRLAVAIEDAGFEIRDQIGWLYGSGFPKSHDVAKGIEKRRVEDQQPVRRICRVVRAAMDAAGLKSRDLVQHFGNCHPRLIDHWAARDTDSQPALPTMQQWEILKSVLPISEDHNAEVARLNDRKGEFGEAFNAREVTGQVDEWTDRTNYALTSRDGLRRDNPATDAARQWQGWGTALKPAWEPIVLARKPLVGTVAANVLAHGTGAINVDGCRIHADDAQGIAYTVKRTAPGATQNATGNRKFDDGTTYTGQTKPGRWPANVIHDGSEEVVAAFPAEAGAAAPVRGTEASAVTAGIYGDRARVPGAFHADSGSAARFFYSAKADAGDRLGSKHPTVKPVDLMAYLCRLVTPPGGTVLDPFAGSGTTGMACMREGFRAVLIEREAEYVADIKRRLAHVKGEDAPLFAGGK